MQREERIPSELFPELLKRYAQVVVRHGLNVQPGQLVHISGEVAHRRLIGAVTQEAYRRGASFVNVELVDPLVSRSRILESQPEFLTHTPAFLSAKFDELVEKGAANLKIVGPEYPDYLSDLDPKRVNKVRQASYQAAKRFYTEGIGCSKVHWCVIAGATPAWGERVFPDLRGGAAEEALWRELFRVCRADSDDALERWQRHNAYLSDRARALTNLRIKELRFSGPGTELRVGLSERAVFKGGSDRTPSGQEFEPNLPTEECFTTPDWRETDGVVSATRPFYVNGKLIKDLVMTFKSGELVQFSCSEGRSTFESYIESDAGGKRLGEVALVGIDSPVYQSGLVFQEILLDENAACHIALGSAYKGCLEGGARLSDQECYELGCNISSVHTDIMISSEKVDVSASLASGESLTLLLNGRWTGGMSR